MILLNMINISIIRKDAEAFDIEKDNIIVPI
jgi:hypothetical protein